MKEHYYYKAVPATDKQTMYVIVHRFADGHEEEFHVTFFDVFEAEELVDDLNHTLGEDILNNESN